MNQLAPVPWTNVAFDRGFLGQRHAVNRTTTLPIEHQQCKSTGRIDAFKLQWKPGDANRPHPFWDSDIGKWIEAAGFSLATHPDPALESQCDEVIDLIASAQQPDGYLNVYYCIVEPGKRWTNLRDMHELYCAGHLIEAAVAYWQGTGKPKLLEVMSRYVKHIAEKFGPSPDQQPGYCGHPEIELALIKLHRATSDIAHLQLAEFFVRQRGTSPYFFEAEARQRGETPDKQWFDHLDYLQADKPIVDQKTLNGHAVRALYLMSGAVDVAAATGDKKLLAACKRLWKNVTLRRMYITGGVGSSRHHEKFTFDYDLPNETAYAETCANISLALFAHRLLQIEPSNEYADVIERTLFNGIASGVSLTGDRFFYANPLAIDDEALQTSNEQISGARKEWFGCSCCPPNVARIYAWMGQLLYSTSKTTIFTHLYAASRAVAKVGVHEITLRQETNYPWDSTVSIQVDPKQATRFTIALRTPGWCDGAKIAINAKATKPRMINGYAHLTRAWNPGDTIELTLPMPVRLIEANPHCRNDFGKLAVQRGPIVYCAEEADNRGLLPAIMLETMAKPAVKFEPKLLGGVTTLTMPATAITDQGWNQSLYRPVGQSKTKRVKLKMIPYCVWGNRKLGKMQVWFETTNSARRSK